ncbi:hypothetical protein VTI28DRAFT_1999 [Corynascus sepedonium]
MFFLHFSLFFLRSQSHFCRGVFGVTTSMEVWMSVVAPDTAPTKKRWDLGTFGKGSSKCLPRNFTQSSSGSSLAGCKRTK